MRFYNKVMVFIKGIIQYKSTEIKLCELIYNNYNYIITTTDKQFH